MDIRNVNRFSIPITTGNLNYNTKNIDCKAEQSKQNINFGEMLKAKLANSPVEFSKHATERVLERNLNISEKEMQRLSRGVEIAKEKGLDDTLILIDKTAYIVSAKNQKVITAVNGDELHGNVFTNIDGTVII